MSEAIEYWERQSGESAAAFAAFTAYRDMGPARSLRKLEEALKAEAIERGSSKRQAVPKLSSLFTWSARYRWQLRAAAWDAEVDRHKRAAHLAAIEEMAARHAAFACQVQEVTLKRWAAITPEEIAAMSPALAFKIYSEAAALERLSRGAATAIIQQAATEAPNVEEAVIEDFKGTLKGLSCDQLAELELLLSSYENEPEAEAG